MRTHTAGLFLALWIGWAAAAHQPLPDATVDEAWNAFESVWLEMRAGRAEGADLIAAYNEHLETLPFERMTARQLASLDRMAFQFGSGMGRSLDRLAAILQDEPDDLHAMIRFVDLLFWAKPLGYPEPVDASGERIAPLLDRILAHPDLSVAVEDGTAALVPLVLTMYGDEEPGLAAQRSGYKILIEQAARSTTTNDLVVLEIGSRWRSVKRVGFDASQLSTYRDMLLPRIQSALAIAQAHPEPGLQERNIIYLANQGLGMLTSAAATRDFVGSPAPELTIQWSSDKEVGSLDDLRGKVVLLNFWVTGCGHCINALPKMQDLADRFKGANIVILGVTSLQGRHFGGAAARPVDTSGQPNLEYELMREFVAANDISWPIVFTKESAWNPAYEVRGTPHLTLIDPNGIVVNNSLHPSHDPDQIVEAIDAVLIRFGLDATTSLSGRSTGDP